MSEIEILRKVNDLNLNAALSRSGITFWCVIVLYNWVIYAQDCEGNSRIHDTAKMAREDA